ncbi:MAG: hypothetical protein HY591_06920 [Candidatus Omnitrophica bacterium]|nr:hypothetical protein [Candidatus Omnitrophota bacterium]
MGLAIAAIIGMSVYNLLWSGMKLDDKLRRMHGNYMEALKADQMLTKDLENAIGLDLSANYPDQKVFDGQKHGLAFLTVTPQGIRRVRYSSGMVDFGKVTKTLIGKKISRLDRMTFLREGALPIEFLLRQETSLADWANEVKTQGRPQVVAAGLRKGTFNCRYAPFTQDMHVTGRKAIVYADHWDKQGLPMAVSCGFSLYDHKNPRADIMFRRDIFLAPLERKDGNG